MDEGNSLLTSRQLGMLLWAGMVSPLIRQVPGVMTDLAGGAAWLSALLCVPAAGLLGLFTAGMLRSRAPGEGLGEQLCRTAGPLPGRLTAGVFGSWAVFYAGFVLRAGADRFVSAMYPDSRDWPFMAVMGLLALMAGAGRLKTLARCAQITAPVLWAVFAAVFLFCLPNADLSELWPPAGPSPDGVLRAAVPMLWTMGVGVLPAFLAGETEPGSLSGAFGLPMMTLAGLGAVLCAATAGTFGPELTGELRYPFFVMLRGVRVFDLLERVEALIVVQWAAADFLLLGTLLHLARRCLALALRGPGTEPGRTGAFLCAGAAFLCGRGCAGSAFALRELGERFMAPVTGALAFALLPLVWAVGRLRRKKQTAP